MAGGFIYMGGGTELQKACGFDDSVDNMVAFLNVAMGPGADENRIGDHIWYISDTRKFQSHYPSWGYTYDLEQILSEIAEALSGRLTVSA